MARLRNAVDGCRSRLALVPAVVALAFCVPPAQAQLSDLEASCTTAGGSATSCALAADVSDIAGIRALVLAAGGSAVTGSASTVGQRTPGSPRWALTARMTGGGVEMPGPGGSGGTVSGTALSWNADMAVGLIEGATVGATVGGVGSIDLLASVGLVNLPADAGFRTRSPVTAGLGARVGIFRESFTVPGVSVSAMYRRLGSFSVGDLATDPAEAHVRSESGSAWSLRAGIGKRISLFGVTAGVGYDRLSSDISVDAGGGSGAVTITDDSFTTSRTSVFAGLLWTRLVYGLSAEFGWQRAGQLDDARDPASDARGGGFFLSLAARLTI